MNSLKPYQNVYRQLYERTLVMIRAAGLYLTTEMQSSINLLAGFRLWVAKFLFEHKIRKGI